MRTKLAVKRYLRCLRFMLRQMVFVSLGAPRRERKGEGVQLPASCLPPPQKEHIPMLLLLQEPHLTTLFDLLEMLACFKPPGPDRPQHSTEVQLNRFDPENSTVVSDIDQSLGMFHIFTVFVLLQSVRCEELHLHAENLSRRVWELLMLLPTCPSMLQAFQNISDEAVSKVTTLS